VGHVTRMGEMRMHTNLWSESQKRRDHSEHLDVDGKTMLEWILRKYSGKF
jgi:hypothetical protein